jgi:hypothetical protein
MLCAVLAEHLIRGRGVGNLGVLAAAFCICVLKSVVGLPCHYILAIRITVWVLKKVRIIRSWRAEVRRRVSAAITLEKMLSNILI